MNYDEQYQPVSLRSATTALMHLISDRARKHSRTAAVYSNYRKSVDSNEVHSRKDAVLLAQMRCGPCHLFTSTYDRFYYKPNMPSLRWNTAVGPPSFVSHMYGNLWASRPQPRRLCYISEAGHRAGRALTRSLSAL